MKATWPRSIVARADTRESFVEKSVARYGKDRFDLSGVKYAGSKVQVAVRCLRHNHTFLIRPGSFLRACIESGGCQKCEAETRGRKMRNLYTDSKEVFIAKAKSIWGDRFDYSEVKYINNRSKVIVRCIEHDLHFKITPSNHKSGPGCPECKISTIKEALAMTQEDYERICRSIHGNEYIYGKYCGMNSPIRIKCLVHGWFTQIANDHRRGSRCNKCAMETRKQILRLGRDEFIARAEIAHGFKYDYSKLEYYSTRDNVAVICPVHGLFSINAGSHIAGQGCQACSRDQQKKNRLASTEEFISKAKSVHGDTYDYAKSRYVGVKEPVWITCKTHGDFVQIPNYHLTGNGCQRCGDENKGKDGIINFLRNTDWGSNECYLYIVKIRGFVKIGIAKDFEQRNKNSGSVYQLLRLWRLRRVEAWLVEQNLLRATSSLKPGALPDEFTYWAGKTELRTYSETSLASLISEAERQVAKIKAVDWLDYAVNNRIGILGSGWNGE